METPAAGTIPIVGKELKQNPKPDDAVAWEEGTRQWFNQEHAVDYLEAMEDRQRTKFATTPGADRARGAHLVGAATAKVLASLKRKGAEEKNLKTPIFLGQAISDARKGLPGYEEVLADEQAADAKAAAEQEEAGRVPRDRVIAEGSEQPSEPDGKVRIDG